MKIEIVQLENIRSHVKSTVPFARGFNCLVGGLGCGKSSILYSIDFALFGDPVGRSFEYLLREGANSGTVTVQFVQNGKTYKISRGLNRRGKGISQDSDGLKLLEDDNLISSVKNEAVAEQLKAITGLDRELFREIVWVRQEHLKEFLDAQPRERQRRFDELFGLSEYEIAWASLANYQRDYEVERKIYEKDADVAGLERLGAEYNRTAEEFSLLEIELQGQENKLTSAKKALEESDLQLKRLEDVKTQNDELRRKEARILANSANLQEALASLAQNVENKKKVVQSLKQRLNAIETQKESYDLKLKEIGISADQPIETLRCQIATFDDQISNLKGEQEATLKNMQTDKKRTVSLSAENRCPLCLQCLADDYKNGLIQRIHDENTEREKTVSQLRREIAALQNTRDRTNTVISNLQTIIPRIDELETRIKEETGTLTEIINDYENKQKLAKQTSEQLELVRIELGRFDVSKLEASKSLRDEAFRRYYQLDSEFRTKQNSKRDLTKRIDEVKNRIDQAQQKIERMERIRKAGEIIGVIRDGYRSIQPKLRSEFVKVLRNFVQQVLDSLVGGEGSLLNVSIDENYTPYVLSENGIEREVSNLSGGERTLLAFAYRLGLGQLIMQSRTGHGLSMLLLDEPTESLGREDGSIDRLADAVSRFKAIEQTIAVTHSEAFAEKAEHVIRLEKEAGVSKVSVEK